MRIPQRHDQRLEFVEPVGSLPQHPQGQRQLRPCHDPHVPELPEHSLASVDLEPALDEADLACIVTAHPEVDYEAVVRGASRVLDFRGVTRGLEAPNLVRL